MALREPTEDQLALDWTLSLEDIQFVYQKSRGIYANLRFASQLCHLRAYHSFIDQGENVSVVIVNYLCRQLEIEPTDYVPNFDKRKQDYKQKTVIALYLGYHEFSDHEKKILESWLVIKLQANVIDTKILKIAAMDYLKSHKIIFPPAITLGRLIGKAVKSAYVTFYQAIIDTLPTAKLTKISKLGKPSSKGVKSPLAEYKESPFEANAEVMNTYLDKINKLKAAGIYQCNLKHIDTKVIQYLASLGRQYNAFDLKKLEPQKRLAILICFFYQASQDLLDIVVELHKQILTDINRRARNEVKIKREEIAKKNKGKYQSAGEFIEHAIGNAETSISLQAFMEKFNQDELLSCANACKLLDLLNNPEKAQAERIRTRFVYLRRYSKLFLQLDFEATPGLSSLLKAIKLLRQYHANKITALPNDAPTDFLEAVWRESSIDNEKNIDPHYWELGVYYAIKKQLGVGDLYLKCSANNRYFWDIVNPEDNKKPEQMSLNIQLPNQANNVLNKLMTEFDQIAQLAKDGLSDNEFAQIINGELKLHQDDALQIPKAVTKLKKLIAAHLPKVRIEKLVADAESLCGFSAGLSRFQNPDVSMVPNPIKLKPIVACIIAQGTNIGIFSMGLSAEGITADMLKTASINYLCADNLEKSNALLIKQYLSYPISECFGDGNFSTSDGQRYLVQASCMLSGFYPRFFGYYNKAISLYTHVSKDSVFGTQVISCNERESTYVLTGLLQNKTIIDPKIHCTDTHGYTEHIFALFYLLGFSFHPRIKDLSSQRVYNANHDKRYAEFDEWFSGKIDCDLIKDNWEQLIRIVYALKNGLAPAHVIIHKLANRTDAVSKAIRELGRLIKSIYILRYIADKDLRYTVHLHLNRGESRHQLAKNLFFANRGAFKTNNRIEIMNKASCLSLLSNAVLLWNTYHIQKIIEKLRANGYEILDEHLEKISPLMFKHIQIHGTYHFENLFAEAA